MKSLLKPVFLGTALSTLGLCCTISYAASLKPMKSFDEQLLASNQIVALKVVQQTNMPQLIKTKRMVVSNILNKPLLSLTTNDSSVLKTGAPVKKNEFFEVAAIFNDKLQQFLSYFDNNRSGGISTKKYTAHEDVDKTCRKSKI